MNKFENDLTTGSVFKKLILFAIPFFISSLLQSIYGVADMIILGNFSGPDSLSAVNTGSQLMIIITNLATGIATGGTVMIGNYLGANKKDLINKSIGTLLTTLLFLGVSLGLLTFIFVDPLLNVLNVPEGAFEEAHSYLVISTLGVIFIYGYNALSAIMRGMGDSKTPLIFITISCVTNVVLDLLLVSVLEKGAGGAAFATIFSQGLSMVLCIIYLRKNNFTFDFKPSSFVIDKKILSTLLKIGLPQGIQQVCNNFSFLFLTSMINDLGGVSAGAASGVVNKFNAFAILPCIAISSSVSAMISQNLGAKKYDRIKQVTRIGFLLGLIICAIVFVIANVFTKQIFDLFGGDADMMEIGVKYMHAFSFEYATLGFIVGFNSVFIGYGNGVITLITNLISSFLVRMPVAVLLGKILEFGVVGVGCAIPIATLVGSTIAGIFYFSGIWKKTAVTI